jgi:hypothetical protein
VSQFGQIDATDHVPRLTRDPVYRWAEVPQRERRAGKPCRRRSGIDWLSWRAM